MTTTDVSIENPDGMESFTLKSARIEFEGQVNMTVKSIVSGAGDLVGGAPYPSMDKRKITAEIQNMDSSDYPNSSSYSDHDLGYERELRRALYEWGPNFDGTSTLYVRSESIPGVMTNLRTTESMEDSSNAPETFEIEIEWISVDLKES